MRSLPQGRLALGGLVLLVLAARARIVHDPDVHDGGELLVAKDVLGLLAANVELEVLHVLRAPFEGASIDADHRQLA